MEGFSFGLRKYYFTDVDSTLVFSTDVCVESTGTDVDSTLVSSTDVCVESTGTDTDVESVVVTSVLVVSFVQDANNATTPIDKITFLIVCFFLFIN